MKGWRCALCESERFISVGRMIVECPDCSLVATHPAPDDEELQTRYGSEYYGGWDGSGSRRRLWGRRLRVVREFVPRGRVLDVGCGSGEFLEVARREGFEVAGTEFSPAARSSVRGSVVYRDVTEAAGEWDAVTLWHVLEHVRSPREMLVTIRQRMKPRGFLFVAVPNLEARWFNLVYRCVKGRWPELYSAGAKEPHLFHFRRGTLELLLERTGLVPLRVSPDVPDADPRLRIIDLPARALFYLLGINWTLSLLVVARKK